MKNNDKVSPEQIVYIVFGILFVLIMLIAAKNM